MASLNLPRAGGGALRAASSRAAAAGSARLAASSLRAPAPAGLRLFVSIGPDGSKVIHGLPPAQGLYNPSMEKDACGTG
jgi:hypothetical protein